jgi:hypothetical protein
MKTADCNRNEHPRNQVQGWDYDGCGYPRYVVSFFHSSIRATYAHTPHSASYGSLARFKSIQRLHAVGNTTVLGASGDMSDFQYVQQLLDDLVTDEFTAGDGNALGPAEVHEYLARVMYARRSKMNPLWNSMLVGGVKDGKRCVCLLVPRLGCESVYTDGIGGAASCRMWTCWARRTRRRRSRQATARTSRFRSSVRPSRDGKTACPRRRRARLWSRACAYSSTAMHEA